MSLPRNSAVPALADLAHLAHFWLQFGTDVHVCAVPALADLAHCWQQIETFAHVCAVWGFASASTGRILALIC